jgi:hypothetical protein
MSAVAMINSEATAAGLSPDRRLRAACDELVGVAFFGPMLREARENELLSGGAHDLFTAQLDDALIQRSGGALGSSVGQALYRQLTGAGATAARVDIEA